MSRNGTADCLGLIAGAGQFPFLVLQAAQQQGLRAVAVGFSGHTDPALSQKADAWSLLHVGQLGKLLNFFKKQGVTKVLFAGSIDKPKALDVRPDFRAAKVLWRMRGKGDDALLRGIIAELESEGFQVVQAADLLPGLRGGRGVLSSRPPTEEEWDDLRLAWDVGERVGSLDIGQCVVIKRGVVAAVEALEGTDAAITRGTDLAGPGCVVLKRCKPGQDERVDLPAIGLDTVRTLVAGKASCLGFEAGKTLFFDQQAALDLAAKNKIAIVGLDKGDLS